MTRVSYSGIRLGLALTPVALLVACGGLESPVGDLTGRVIGASSGAYAYPLGMPELKVALAIDANRVGTFAFRDLPVNVTASIVLYDGADRAELVPVALEGGRLNQLTDRYGAAATLPNELSRMPLAGTLLAVAVPDGGATPWQPTFAMPETDQGTRTPSAGGTLSIYPLPAGRFALSATLPGFVGADAAVDVAAGATTAGTVNLPVDAGAAAPGCASVSSAAPAACENGLVCETSDGRCYECAAADATHCQSHVCDAETHLCEAVQPANATYCSPCSSSSDCANPSMVMLCRIPDGATSGYCTIGGCSSSADCPAGFECGDDSHVCKPPNGCDAWIQTMASPCYSNEHCGSALKNGWCAGATSTTAGHCTASCRVDADCHVSSVASLVCELGPYGSYTRLQCM